MEFVAAFVLFLFLCYCRRAPLAIPRVGTHRRGGE